MGLGLMSDLSRVLADRGLVAGPGAEDGPDVVERPLAEVLLGTREVLRVGPDPGRVGVWVVWLGDRPVISTEEISERGDAEEMAGLIQGWREACWGSKGAGDV